MRNDKQEKRIAAILLISIVLLFVGFSLYIVFLKTSDDDGVITLQEKIESTMPEIIPGETLNWSTEKISFTLPEGWTYEIAQSSTTHKKVKMYGQDMRLNLVYRDVAENYATNWNNRETVLYQNDNAIVYETDEGIKIALNKMTSVQTEGEDTVTDKKYGLVINIFKNEKFAQELTDVELHYIKYILDGYSKNASK